MSHSSLERYFHTRRAQSSSASQKLWKPLFSLNKVRKILHLRVCNICDNEDIDRSINILLRKKPKVVNHMLSRRTFRIQSTVPSKNGFNEEVRLATLTKRITRSCLATKRPKSQQRCLHSTVFERQRASGMASEVWFLLKLSTMSAYEHTEQDIWLKKSKPNSGFDRQGGIRCERSHESHNVTNCVSAKTGMRCYSIQWNVEALESL